MQPVFVIKSETIGDINEEENIKIINIITNNIIIYSNNYIFNSFNETNFNT